MNHANAPACANRHWTLVVSYLLLSACAAAPAIDTPSEQGYSIEPGPRAITLAQGLPADAPLRAALLSCEDGPFQRTDFSIAHRGAPLGYPEHTVESYRAAARMGAGLVECDVTFTRDLALVCRHSQCDLHRTTNILNTPLARRCSKPFTPATADAPASARCCTSDITLNEFRTLCGRPDHVDPTAKRPADYLATPPDVVGTTPTACGTLVTHAESIALLDALGVDFVPELKRPEVAMPFQGLTHAAYASKMLDEYQAAGIDPERVYPQSFDPDDVRFWLEHYPAFADRAVYLDARGRDPAFRPSLEDMRGLYQQGFRIIAPPIPVLLTLDTDGVIVASDYARYARAAGLDIVTWTLERGRVLDPANFIYATVRDAMRSESGLLEVLHALHEQVGVRGVFTDWAGTVTYYANCLAD